jgi:hypothetical protein
MVHGHSFQALAKQNLCRSQIQTTNCPSLSIIVLHFFQDVGEFGLETNKPLKVYFNWTQITLALQFILDKLRSLAFLYPKRCHPYPVKFYANKIVLNLSSNSSS